MHAPYYSTWDTRGLGLNSDICFLHLLYIMPHKNIKGNGQMQIQMSIKQYAFPQL